MLLSQISAHLKLFHQLIFFLSLFVDPKQSHAKIFSTESDYSEKFSILMLWIYFDVISKWVGVVLFFTSFLYFIILHSFENYKVLSSKLQLEGNSNKSRNLALSLNVITICSTYSFLRGEVPDALLQPFIFF